MRNAILRRGSRLFRAVALLTGSGTGIVVTPPAWRVRISRWFVALVACVLIFQGYNWGLVPWIEPPPPPPKPPGDRLPYPGQIASDPVLEQLFPPGAWERDKPMELRTQWGRLLFQKYTRIDKGIELQPCTILFNAPTTARDGKRGKRTIVLKTPNKAVLSFSGDMNFVRAQVGELKGALLKGEVKIYSRETSAGANDALNIITRDIQILPTQIWTPHDVAFEYGSSRGSGRVLSITIASQEKEDSSDAKQALVQNIEMLELVHVDRLHLDFPGKGLLGDSLDQARPPVDGTASTPAPTAVDVSCQGPFQFDFRKGIAVLQDHVDVVRVNPGSDSDQLRCDRLLIYFQAAPLPDSSAPQDDTRQASSDALAPTSTSGAASDRKSAVPKMAISRLEATGAEVTLQAPSVQVAARGQLLQYDFHTRRILLQDSQKALFVYQQHVVETPRLEYELHENSKRLGRLWATGPGVYRGAFGKTTPQPVQAVWQGTLELQPQDDLHVLSVAQGAEFKWGATGQFSADRLFFWLAEVVAEESPPSPGVATTVPTGPLASVAAAAEPGLSGLPLEASGKLPAEPSSEKKKLEVLPVKMLAQGNVQANSEQFTGETTKLEIWFDHPVVQPPNSEPLQPAAGRAVAASDPLVDDIAAVDAAKPPQEVKRLELSGTQIRLRLWMVKPRPTVREATILGQVRLAQLAPVPTDPALLLVTGDMLQLRTDQLDRSAVDVRGDADRPARVQAQGMLLEGSNLHVSQRENLMWSEGPGRTRLPAGARTAAANPVAANSADTNSSQSPPAEANTLAPTAPIWISWQGGMDFDGQLIRFMKQVEVSGIYTSKTGEQLHLRSIGDQLHATLNHYVEFAKTKKTDDLDVIELRFLGDVFTENQTFSLQNTLTSQDRMKARDLTLDRSTGQFNALGPGWITTTRIDKGEMGNRVGAVEVSGGVSPTGVAGGPEKLVYLRIDYQNAIQGNLDLREGEFVHFVRTVYGPVLSWDQTLDPDRRGGLGPQGIVMTCNQLKIAEMGGGGRRAIEMSALGNTIVEGSKFLAKADRLTYAEAKDLLIFEGVGRNFATLQQRSHVGAEPSEFQARKIMYGIKSGLVDVKGAKALNYNQLGAPPDIPKARIR